LAGPIDLAPLLGRWRTKMRFPKETLDGEASFEWLDEGGLMVMRSRTLEAALPPTAVAVIGFDDSSERWSMVYHDDRGVSRIYAMTFDGTTWTLQSKPKDFHQRFRATVAPASIEGVWEKSDDGQTWGEDFSLTYLRAA